MSRGLSFYVNNTAPSLTITIRRENIPIDLTGATVNFQMFPSGGTILTVSSPCVILDSPVNGQVRYDWGIKDLSVVGSYLCNLLITYADGTFENTETTSLVVFDSIPPTL
jgi:hypothetical protein